MKTPRVLAVVTAVALIGVGAGWAMAQATRPATDVRMVDLPFQLPAIGNLDAVEQWVPGRIQSVEQIGDAPDVILELRTIDGGVHRVVAPRALVELAAASRWFDPGVKSRPGRADFAERMVAFDVDQDRRLIAMISLEPMDRDRRRLRRAIGR
ncbi:MAG: hypothetical protein ACYTG1_03430 [Planctomycetota bacterium]|jgi:hypothetical protein